MLSLGRLAQRAILIAVYINSNHFNFVGAIRASAWSVLLVALFAGPGQSGAAQRAL